MVTILTKPIAENIILLNHVSWETFNRLLEELGDQRNQLLSYYLGNLEIMSPLGEHENNNRFIDDIIRAIADELNINLKKFGSLTLKSNQEKQAVEPDSCYYINNEPLVRNKQHIDLDTDPPPDLVLEIDITSASLNKLPIYATLKVPEIWRYNGQKLTIFCFNSETNSHQQCPKSKIFSWLNLDFIPQLINQSLNIGETATLKQFRQCIKDNIDHIQ
ncbi:flavodoxin reductases (ferredoxin-NADPH reductases) family 1 [Geminocystis sp. NIES-3708]|uniref:Uma2 family endonuclease n=1 Tax=Geminocystis sp. NIES-3708 TaxID=1615909 RepID=UPI0005FC6D1F|nr:Uma2 family endonuclease [Geminocystis sp. NIES-3708]BAQ61562.1 flavodoxin reductases (ferredoxin-NADPH reductases) family 1 [Geminocystis sp. NIES-3708]